MNRATDGWGRRPWRRIAVPGDGTANTGQEGAHEHQWTIGEWFVYLVERETEWKGLSTGGPSSNSSGGRRLGMSKIPAKGRSGLMGLELRSKRRGWRSYRCKELDWDEVSASDFGGECTVASSGSGDRGEEHRAS
jgi:hypothetical protein